MEGQTGLVTRKTVIVLTAREGFSAIQTKYNAKQNSGILDHITQFFALDQISRH